MIMPKAPVGREFEEDEVEEEEQAKRTESDS